MVVKIASSAKYIYTSNGSSPLHHHPYYEIIMYFSGNGSINFGEKKYFLEAGNIAFIHPNTQHKSFFKKGNETISVGFYCDEMPYKITTPVVILNNIKEVSNAVTAIYREVRTQPPFYQEKAAVHMENIILEMARSSYQASAKRADELTSIYNYLCENYADKINFKIISNEAGFNYDYFRRVFKNKFGISPQNLLIEKRFEAAKELIEASSLPITDIVMSCGFSNASQFSRMFRDKFGTTPTIYRNNFLKANRGEKA